MENPQVVAGDPNAGPAVSAPPTAGVVAREIAEQAAEKANEEQAETMRQAQFVQKPQHSEKKPTQVGGAIGFTAYKELPPPIVKYLEDTWGNWLNYFPIRRREWKKDYDDYGIEIEVPEKFSTEWHKEKRQVYDNNTRGPKLDKDGKPVMAEVITPDIRRVNLKVGTDKIKGWLDKVKKHIIDKAFQKGIKLPNTQTEYQNTPTREEYTRDLHRV